MTNTDTGTLWIIVALVAAAVVIIATIASIGARRRARVRGVRLRERFGPEYNRALQEFGSPARAEHELAARARRVDHLRFRDLDAADRARFASTWSRIQAQFVDDPAGAAMSANELIKEVMLARGYPSADFEQRVADLSVDHAAVIQHYRAAHALSEVAPDKRVNTEDLRQAVVHYRALFADLLQESTPTTQPLREAHAR
jgi:hypothetical protein